MEKEKNTIVIDEELILLPPYWIVEYIDSSNEKHLANVKNKGYLFYLESNFRILEKKLIKN